MVLCVVFGCSKRSGRNKDVRIPKTLTKGSSNLKELSKKCRAGFIAAISREDVTEKILVNDRICSRHFISGQPAALEDNTNPDWLPTLHLAGRHISEKRSIMAGTERWRRRKAREDAQQHRDEVLSESTNREQGVSESTQQEASMESGIVQRVETTRQQEIDNFIVPRNTTETGVQTLEAEMISIQSQTDLSSKKILELQTELETCHTTIRQLNQKISCAAVFSEQYMSLQSSGYVRFYTGLPSYKVLKTIFDFVTHELSSRTEYQHITKFTAFQEYMIALAKLRLDSNLGNTTFRLELSSSSFHMHGDHMLSFHFDHLRAVGNNSTF